MVDSVGNLSALDILIMTSELLKNPLSLGMLGLSLTVGGFFLKKYYKPDPIKQEFKSTVALLGDVGGTNIRFEMVVIQPPHNEPESIIKKQTYLVVDHPTFQSAVQKFLEDVEVHPTVAVIGIAGPIADNRISMANVPKWGVMDGNELGVNLKIKDFKFINDFEAVSYGILLLSKDQFISINQKDVDEQKVRGILGPGTGLGNSLLYTTPFRKRYRTYVLASEGGHTDFPTIDSETCQYFEFFKKAANLNYISLERAFCGPSLPYMLRFFASKYPNQNDSADLTLSPEAIMQKCLEEEPSLIFQKIFELFLKIYASAIGNFICHHMCIGGLYLVGKLTNSLIEKIKDKDILKEWKQRHPEIIRTIETVPIVVCKEIDLGLKGAFFAARRIISDEQHS